jgi:hypothetical protein
MMLALAACGPLWLGTLTHQAARLQLPVGEGELSYYRGQPALALDWEDRVTDANAPALLLLAQHGVWQPIGRRVNDLLAGPLRDLGVRRADEAMVQPMREGCSGPFRQAVHPLTSGIGSGGGNS